MFCGFRVFTFTFTFICWQDANLRSREDTVGTATGANVLCFLPTKLLVIELMGLPDLLSLRRIVFSYPLSNGFCNGQMFELDY